METIQGTEPAEPNDLVNENSELMQPDGLFVSRSATNCIEEIFIKMEEPGEPLDELTNCRMLNRGTVDIIHEIAIKVENANDCAQYGMDETGHTAQRCHIVDPLCWIKMESEEDEFPLVKMEQELHVVEPTDMLEQFNLPERGRLRKRPRHLPPTTPEIKPLVLEHARIAGRLTNETVEQTSRPMDLCLVQTKMLKTSRRTKRERGQSTPDSERPRYRQPTRLKNETAEQRSRRLERQRLIRANETAEERAERLEHRRMWRLMYMAKETEEQRTIRLARQKIAGLKWRSKLTEEQRNASVQRAKVTQMRRLKRMERLKWMKQHHLKGEIQPREQGMEEKWFDGTLTEQVDCTRVKVEMEW